MPAHKKARLSAVHASIVSDSIPTVSLPGHDSPAPAPKAPKLPSKINEGRPLPTLPERQTSDLPDEEYQSIASSATLAASLHRSKQRWIYDGMFERYWVKPETGKHAKPPPPNNPEAKWMKSKGPCRIRVEPHVFEVDMYLEEKPKPPPPPKQYVPPISQTAFGQPYRPSPTNQQYIQRQTPIPAAPTNHQAIPQHIAVTAPSVHNSSVPTSQRQQPTTQVKPTQSMPTPATDKKQSPDPVISMLAARASSDPELKGLMKEVATGHANPEQLKIFQRHIDELTAIIQKQKNAGETTSQQPPPQINAVKSEPVKNEQPASTPQHAHPSQVPPPQVQSQQRPPPPQPRPSTIQIQAHNQQPLPPPPAPQFKQQQPWVPPAAVAVPVILGFTTPGASEDRFLFPQYSVLEALSPQHSLVSFIVTRRGRDAVDSIDLDPEAEYWQPVTMMLEVAYGREELLNHVRRWVKPPEETRKHMEEIMSRCTRAPKLHLALRLPHRGASAAELDEIYGVLASTQKEGTSQGAENKVKKERKSGGKAANILGAVEASASQTAAPASETPVKKPGEEAKPLPTPDAGEATQVAGDEASHEKDVTAMDIDKDVEMTDATNENEHGRPRRNTRKSVRISEGVTVA